jgi:hypothetical protein
VEEVPGPRPVTGSASPKRTEDWEGGGNRLGGTGREGVLLVFKDTWCYLVFQNTSALTSLHAVYTTVHDHALTWTMTYFDHASLQPNPQAPSYLPRTRRAFREYVCLCVCV